MSPARGPDPGCGRTSSTRNGSEVFSRSLEKALLKTEHHTGVKVTNVTVDHAGKVLAGLINTEGKYTAVDVTIDNIKANNGGKVVAGVVEGVKNRFLVFLSLPQRLLVNNLQADHTVTPSSSIAPRLLRTLVVRPCQVTVSLSPVTQVLHHLQIIFHPLQIGERWTSLEKIFFYLIHRNYVDNAISNT